jgi:hypothetical protein
MNSLEEKLKAINEEFKFDAKFSIEVLGEKSFLVPEIKHKWVAKLHNVRFKLLVLEEERRRIINFESKIIGKRLKVGVTEAELNKIKIDNNERLNEIEPQIVELKFLEETLRELSDLLTYNLTNDIKHMIEMHKLETQ